MARSLFLLLLGAIGACRAIDEPEPIVECDDYVAATRECSSRWTTPEKDPSIAILTRGMVVRRDAGAEEREDLRAKCRRAAERARRRCGGEP